MWEGRDRGNLRTSGLGTSGNEGRSQASPGNPGKKLPVVLRLYILPNVCAAGGAPAC